MRTVTPLDSSPNYTIQQMWNNQLTYARATIKLGLEAAEALSAASDQPWLCWRSLNRLRTGIGRAKTMMTRWGCIYNTHSVNCDCGEPQTLAHLLCCRLRDEPCPSEDLTIVTERAKARARMWQHFVRRTREKGRTGSVSSVVCRCSVFALLFSIQSLHVSSLASIISLSGPSAIALILWYGVSLKWPFTNLQFYSLLIYIQAPAFML